MNPPQGLVADLVRFSWVDGPGNRYVIFLQGCSFNCLVCHNPHTIAVRTRRARSVSVTELVDEIRPLAPFLAGVTVSGGEPTVQAPFVRALFEAFSAELPQLTRFIDSNGNADSDTWRSLLPVTDGVMLDLKALDPEAHRYLTGSDNTPVLDAIKQIAAAGKLYEVRLLLIPGLNDDPRVVDRTVRWLLDVDPALRIKVIRFRAHGVRTAARSLIEATPETVDRYREQLATIGVRDWEVV